MLLAHSYGGIPATEALKGVTKAEREKEGKKGGVVRIGYLTCLVAEVGQSAVNVLANQQASDTTTFDVLVSLNSKPWLRSSFLCCSEGSRLLAIG